VKKVIKDTANQTLNAAKGVASTASGAAGKTIGFAKDTAAFALGAIGQAGRAIGSGLFPSLVEKPEAGTHRKAPGAAPGIENLPDLDVAPVSGSIGISCVDLGEGRIESRNHPDLDALFAEERPAWSQTRWINVNGLHPYVVNQLMERFGFHTLAAEDVLTTPQRPKMESYGDHLFIVARMLTCVDGELGNEQVSFFFFNDLLVTFQERPGDVWEPVRKRMEKTGNRFQNFGTAYLLYALLDAIVDHLFPVLEGYGDILESIEDEVVIDPIPDVQRRIHRVKRDLIALRRVMWPMREVMNRLQRDEDDLIEDEVEIYFRDVHDHAVQVIDVVESLREIAGGLNDLFMSSVGNRMNEIMKVLTIMASFFIPITFVAGVYGMNFDFIPELKWKYSYAVFWGVCLTISAGLAVYFYRKGWIGGGKS
jgi:magnesium transporter